MQLYGITHPAPTDQLLNLAKGWAAGGVHFIQLRQKQLEPAQLYSLAKDITITIAGTRSKLLVNIAAPPLAELALAAGADGVHIAGKPASRAVNTVRHIFPAAIITVPCHTLEDVAVAVAEQVDALLFSPVFEKIAGPSHPQGLDALRRACDAADAIPVFALGGMTAANAHQCIAAGATGVAGIRLFAGNDWRRLPAS